MSGWNRFIQVHIAHRSTVTPFLLLLFIPRRRPRDLRPPTNNFDSTALLVPFQNRRTKRRITVATSIDQRDGSGRAKRRKEGGEKEKEGGRKARLSKSSLREEVLEGLQEGVLLFRGGDDCVDGLDFRGQVDSHSDVNLYELTRSRPTVEAEVQRIEKGLQSRLGEVDLAGVLLREPSRAILDASYEQLSLSFGFEVELELGRKGNSFLAGDDVDPAGRSVDSLGNTEYKGRGQLGRRGRAEGLEPSREGRLVGDESSLDDALEETRGRFEHRSGREEKKLRGYGRKERAEGRERNL